MSKMSRSDAGRLGALKTNKLWAERYNNQPKYCLGCKEKLPYEKRKNKFCNHSCSASYNNLETQRNFTKGLYKKKNCLCCGVLTDNIKFCSPLCHRKHKWNECKANIELSGRVEHVFTAKKYLTEVHGNKCCICGVTGWQGKKLVLVLDHINGNPYDWSLVNLRLLCPNCDSQTSTYKGKNAGNGRYNRQQRYAEGKSF